MAITDLMDMSFSKLQEMVMDREAWCAAARGVTKSWTQLSDWTELIQKFLNSTIFIGFIYSTLILFIYSWEKQNKTKQNTSFQMEL